MAPEYDLTEADTCRKFITPKLESAGWHVHPCSFTQEQTFTDGRIIVTNGIGRRGKGKRADYILRYRDDFPIAVVEAKKYALPAGTGLQQAKEYAQILDLKFAYATNGQEIIEFDFLTGQQRTISEYPTPEELWERLQAAQHISDEAERHLLAQPRYENNRRPRYYQQTAINRTIQAITQGQKRILLTMATGTGKTFTAFQIVWKLWSTHWNRLGQSNRKPRILFLADRNILVDDPKDKDFAVFGDARYKIENGKISKSREIYFALYQAITDRDGQPGLYRDYPRDFFDLIIVDECHRGSAREESNWRQILDYFAPAYQIGLTATPKRDDNIDTYRYFGNPIFEYSLKQGIEDGFLAPYTVHRIFTQLDRDGWQPAPGQQDRYGKDIPERVYESPDFNRLIVFDEHVQAVARHIHTFMVETDPMAKTIVFCVDQEHALAMQSALAVLSPEYMRQNSNYVSRITSDEGDIGRTLLSYFQDPEEAYPVIVTTSKLLTTGVDIPTCKNIILVCAIGSITEFKQIIGRGTRVRDDYNKLFFSILDYTGSATRHFRDDAFDGYPAYLEEIVLNSEGEETQQKLLQDHDPTALEPEALVAPPDVADQPFERRKLYVDDVDVQIVGHLVSELDPEGHTLRTIQYTDYTAEKVRKLYPNSAEMREEWANPANRETLIEKLNERGIVFELLQEVTGQEEADPFDLLCFVAFDAPIRTRRERVSRVYREETAFFEKYSDKARQVLYELLEKYADYGYEQFKVPDILKVPPLSRFGNTHEIMGYFGDAKQLREAVDKLQYLIYAA